MLLSKNKKYIGINKEENKYSCLSIGLLSAVIMLLIMLPSMVQNHGIFVIRGDYIDQYIPRLINERRILMGEGNATWDWNSFLGIPYNSVQGLLKLNAISLLFPQTLIPYVVTFLHLVRVSLIGMSSFSYLRYMVKDKKNAFLASLLYTFSSYTFINLEFMQFIETLWIFPLLLLSVEKMFRSDGYKHQLIFTTFLCCASNFYFFVFSTISFTLYFVCRFFLCDEWKEKRNLQYFFLAVTEYIIGFLCAGFLVAPYLYRIFNSSGSTEKIGSANSTVWYDGIFSKLFSLFTPASSNRINTFGVTRWLTRAAYVPIFGLSFVLAACLNKNIKNRKWIIALSASSILFILVTSVSLVYNMFSSTYTRYSYAMILFFVLATAVFLENYDNRIATKSAYIIIAVFVCLVGIYYFCFYALAPNFELFKKLTYTDTPFENHASQLYRMFAIIAAALSYAFLIAYTKSDWLRKHIIPCVVALIGIYGVSYSTMNLYDVHYLDYFPESSISLQKQVDLYYFDLPTFDPSNDYRIDHSKQLRNYAYVAQKPSISVFESVQNSYSVELASYLSMHNGVVTIFPSNPANDYRTLLGVKYYYDLYPEDNCPVPYDFSYLRTENGINIYQNNNYMGMGFSYDSYITRSEFDSIRTAETAVGIMQKSLVVEDDDEAFVSGILRKYNEPDVTNNHIGFSEFRTTSEGFSAKITTDSPQVMFVSVPYESKGWEFEINGKKAEFIRANVGFMAFITEAGENTVTARYSSPANKVGYAISFAGMFLLTGYLIVCTLTKKKSCKSDVIDKI